MSDEELLAELRSAVGRASEELRREVVLQCPGDHNPRQHRDRKPPWCRDCGRDWHGIQRRDGVPS